MSRKRRVFDIDLPEDDLPQNEQPAEDVAPRRGPMASAIAENAEALQARRSAAEAIRAENDALAHEYVAARSAGQVVQAVPLADVHTYLLVRDRLPGDDIELIDLITSLRDIGLSNPIRVEARAKGDGFELIQGQRRLQAYKALYEETGDEKWAAIPALILSGEDAIATHYRRMVDENIVRKDLSYIEMAEAARNFASDSATPGNTVEEAVKQLFKSASYAKRSHIRSFARLLDLIGDELKYPAEMPRNLGLALLRQLEDQPGLRDRIKSDLTDWDNRSVSDELGVLRAAADLDLLSLDDPAAVRKATSTKDRPASSDPRKAKTTFDIRTSRGRVKCTAAVGRLEIKADRDFSAIDRALLERAIGALVDGLE